MPRKRITLREYLEKLNKLAEKHPEALDYCLYYSKDEEGNGYEPLLNYPEIWNKKTIEDCIDQEIPYDNIILIN